MEGALDMEEVARIVEAADSLWAITAIFLIGIYGLLWKFGGEMLSLARANHTAVKEGLEVSQGVAQSIITNHGSKNLGDAVDRLTENMMQLMDTAERSDIEQAEIARRLEEHMSNSEKSDAEQAVIGAKVEKLIDDFEHTDHEVAVISAKLGEHLGRVEEEGPGFDEFTD